jgi:hypothetical protein
MEMEVPAILLLYRRDRDVPHLDRFRGIKGGGRSR